MKTRFSIVAAAFVALQAAACGGGADQGQAGQASASVRLPLAPGRPGVAYLMLPISGDRGALVSVTSPRIARIELHETMAAGSMSSMRPLPRIAVHDGEVLAFAPGGRHLMLFGVDPALHPGDTVNLSFNFERGAPQAVAARVVAANERRP